MPKPSTTTNLSLQAGRVPSRLCPQCGKQTLRLYSICPTCAESEGRYKTKWICQYTATNEQGNPIKGLTGEPMLLPGCGFSERSERATTSWLNELCIDYGIQTKQSLGIKTITEDGVVSHGKDIVE